MSICNNFASSERFRLLKKKLTQQLVAEADPPYLSSIQSCNTNALHGTVCYILDHLQEVYGTVSPQMIED